MSPKSDDKIYGQSGDLKKIRRGREINGVVFLALGLFLAFAYYFDASTTGIFGSLLLGLGKGLCGNAAYALPVFLIYASIQYFLNKKDGESVKVFLHLLIILLLAATCIQIFNFSYEEFRMITQGSSSEAGALASLGKLWNASVNPSSLAGSSKGSPGGVAGGIIGLGLQRFLGQAGTVIFLILAFIIELIVLLNISFSPYVQKFNSFIKRKFIEIKESKENDSKTNEAAGDSDMDASRERKAISEKAETLAAIDRRKNFAAAGTLKAEDFDFQNLKPMTEKKTDGFKSEEKGFFNFEEDDEDEDGTILIKPSDINFLQSYPEWDPEKSVPEEGDFPEENFASIPVSSHDAGAVIPDLDILSEQQKQLERSKEDFQIPDFLKTAESRKNPAERFEKELDAVLRESREVTDIPAYEPEPEKPEVRPPSANFKINEDESDEKNSEPSEEYKFPPLSLLKPGPPANMGKKQKETEILGQKLEETLHSFGVEARVVNITTGPSITRFELAPGPGVKVSKIVSLTDDIALSLAAVGVRIEAPIPGKSAIGIEIPNKTTQIVSLRTLLESSAFLQSPSKLSCALGRDIPGSPIICDLSKMPHLLIAGATGSGKSVCINSILISILYKASPDEVKLILIDPKVVELSVYNGIPHLLAPVVTDPAKASNTLNWAVVEMTRRYGLFAEETVRDIQSYNEEMEREGKEKLPLILIVIDELSDLMMTAAREVENSISRLTAMARAAGIHLIIATQRPSVDVITGVIKANIPSRIAFAVSSQVDSRTILDMGGAEKLLGKGDMLYYPQNFPKPKRGQGSFVTEKEVENVVSFISLQGIQGYDPDEAEDIVSTGSSQDKSDDGGEDRDELFDEAVDILLEAGYASVSILQRRLNVGYPRAARLIDSLEAAGIVGPHEGAKPRKLLVSAEEWMIRKSQREGAEE